MSPMFPKKCICMFGRRFSRFNKNENKKNRNYKKINPKMGRITNTHK